MVLKHIVWDWNGTILNDALGSAKAIDDMIRKRNLGTVSLEQYREKIVFPVINLYYDSGFDLEKEDYQTICNEYIANYLKYTSEASLHQDAEFALGEFRNKGLMQHIVSASDKNILKKQVNEYGIGSYFTNILGQDNNRADSKVNLAEQLIELIGCKPEEMLFIGDTIHDYEVANEVGFHCALVSNGHCSVERLKKTGSPVYSSLTELIENIRYTTGE